MDGIKEAFSTPHGIIAVLLIIGAIVLCALKVFSIDDFKSYTQVIFGTFTAGHIGVAVSSAFKRPETKKES